MIASELLATAERLTDQEQYDRAAETCRQILLAEPQNIPAVVLLARIARKTDRLQSAEKLLRSYLPNATGSDAGQLWFHLAIVFRAGHRLREAQAAYRRAALADPESAMVFSNLAALCSEMDELDEAGEAARRAVELNPHVPEPLVNLSEVLHKQGDVSGMLDCLRGALSIDPANAVAHWNSAAGRLLCGHWAQGWDHYEWREVSGQIILDRYPQQRWQGQPLAGQKILVHGEQGVGDEILFASCYDDLIARAQHCVFVCDPRLEPIFRRSFPLATVIGYQRRKDRTPVELSEPVDWQVPAGSVPRFLRRRPEDFPAVRPYLWADATAVERWRSRLGALGPGMKVGISWRAGGAPTEQRRRSINLGHWYPLLDVPGVDWVNLQYGYTDRDREWVAREMGITLHNFPEADPLLELDESAALISALDLVISVDNTTVNLSGAMGIPTWTLLPVSPSWRWGLDSDQSIWYAAMRLARKQPGQSWEPVIDQLAIDLRRKVDQHRGSRVPTAAGKAAFGHAARRPTTIAPATTVAAELVDLTLALDEAYEHCEAGRLEEAEHLCHVVLAMTPRQQRALRLLARIAAETGRPALAVDALRRVLAIQERPDALLDLAAVWASEGKTAAAEDELRSALKLDPDFLPARHAIDVLRATRPLPLQSPPRWPAAAFLNTLSRASG